MSHDILVGVILFCDDPVQLLEQQSKLFSTCWAPLEKRMSAGLGNGECMLWTLAFADRNVRRSSKWYAQVSQVLTATWPFWQPTPCGTGVAEYVKSFEFMEPLWVIGVCQFNRQAHSTPQ